MGWSDPVAAYCERQAPGMTGEPLNALTNVAFLAAAFALCHLQRRRRADGVPLANDIVMLPWLVAGVGICSLLFHTLAVRWAGSLDSLSILLYCAVAIHAFMRHAAQSSERSALIAAAGFAVISVALSKLAGPQVLNGSAAYLPNIIALIAVSTYSYRRGALAWRGFTLASAIFVVALALRTADRAWCASLPSGTHFLWHLLAALMIWLVSRELTLQRFAPYAAHTAN